MEENTAATVADLMVSCLEAEGVEYVFGIPGEENIWLVRAIERSSRVRFILVRHEQAASFMADAYGRLTGKAGVCSATLGPGAINLLLGAANANTCSAPLVALGAQVGLNRIFKESHQIVDLQRMFAPVTKWSDTVFSVQAVPEMMRKAFATAQDGRPGAVFLGVPEDIEQAPVGEAGSSGTLAPLQPVTFADSVPTPDAIERAAALINAARSPVVLVGHGVSRDGASPQLVALVEKANLQVAVTFHGKGALPDRHPNALGAVGFMRHDYENFAFDDADLILAVGYELQEFDPKRINADGSRTIVHLHAFAQDTDKCYQPAISLLGSIGLTLDALAAHLQPRPGTHDGKMRLGLDEELAAGAADGSFPCKPARIVADIRAALGDEDIVFADTGAAKMWMARLYPTQFPNTCIISNGLSTMAFALPGAMAAKLAFPQRRVLASMGDAAFLMNSQEIETAVRERIPLVVLIWLDEAYGLIKWKMDLELKEHVQVDFGNPDFVKYAESFGAVGVRIGAADELRPALERALDADGVTVIVCPVDYRENLKLTDRLATLSSKS